MTENLDHIDDWSEIDDTLLDTGGSDSVPPAAKSWLADQRYMHGLLRSMHLADSESREARIEAILAGAKPAPAMRSGFVAAAALLVCAIVGFIFPGYLLPSNLPEAQAAVMRATKLLGEEVDRRFILTVSLTNTEDREVMREEMELTTRPGMRILMVGQGVGVVRTGALRAGCDGSEAWILGGPFNMKRAMPLAQAAVLVANLGSVLDLGYLDLHALLERLPKALELQTIGREVLAANHELLHISAAGALPQTLGAAAKSPAGVSKLDLWVDEATGMVMRIVADTVTQVGFHSRVAFEYLDTVQLEATAYKRPW